MGAYSHSRDIAPARALDSSHRHLQLRVPVALHGTPDRRPRGWPLPYAAVPPTDHPNRPDPERRLRVGYVCADFRAHPLACFAEPVLAAHDRGRFEVYGYATGPFTDAVTQRLAGLADHWREVHGMTHDAVERRIRQDGIDILVDIGGHALESGRPVFARRPAPIQVSWLGAPDSATPSAMDLTITDGVLCPAGGDGHAGTGTLRLPRGFHCYHPPEDAPALTPPPCAANGAVTFGAFLPAAAIGPAVVAAWAEILHRVPGSRLRLLADDMVGRGDSDRFRSMFAGAGIGAGRIDRLPRGATVADRLRDFNTVDIALDSFPYNGTATCEALWMGVPVVTLAGDRPAGRLSASILRQVGLDEFVARDIGDYVDLACIVAADRDLGCLRADLRRRIAASTLGDAAAFTHDLEDGLRRAWRDWCAAA
ncbi:hypothetical protein [Azospirillum sp. TSO35-2]|uniref:O-linked N-acetylglucosamine transferase, SPINDLY family protein n=1 Tax=Azospirillum sp. TSO35-2 TaxID=716796 RepID=UPI000D64E71D|nr:hypothetical protein [Azospirillum sp. TSO35-2]